jgi:hypothetical protein
MKEPCNHKFLEVVGGKTVDNKYVEVLQCYKCQLILLEYKQLARRQTK